MADLSTISKQAGELAEQANQLQAQSAALQQQIAHGGMVDPFIFGITVFVLACFVGYYVVWRVTPALHTPLMSVTNAISSIIAIGALVQISSPEIAVLAGIALVLTSVNMAGGFWVTQRMLSMFRK